jgi:hypothetical protein
LTKQGVQRYYLLALVNAIPFDTRISSIRTVVDAISFYIKDSLKITLLIELSLTMLLPATNEAATTKKVITEIFFNRYSRIVFDINTF